MKKKRRNKRKRSERPKKNTLSKELNKLAWDWARAVTKQRPNPDHVNKKVYCPTCKKSFCLGADNVEVYCRTCFYGHCCIKEMTGRRTCRMCDK